MFPIQIAVLETKPPDVTVREWRSIQKETFETIGRHWYATMLPNHFKSNAHHVYGYRQRSKVYLEEFAKALKFNHNLGGKKLTPLAATMRLTASGLLHTAMTQRGRVVKAYPTRWTVKMPGLKYTPKRQRTSTQPHLQAELTKLLKREIDELAELGKQTAIRLIAAVRVSKHTSFS